jgi:hypothetical protein
MPAALRRDTQSIGWPEQVTCLIHVFSMTLDNQSSVSKLSTGNERHHALAEKSSVTVIRLMPR